MDYVPVFVANNFYKNRTAFKREHVVYNTFTKFPKVDRYINVGKLLRHRKQLLVDMSFERHTKRRIIEVPLLYNKDALEMVLKKRWNVYENRPLRDVAEMFLVGRRIVNSDPSRLEMVYELWKKHPKLIVFYNFNFELEALRRIADYFIPGSSLNGSMITSKHNTLNGTNPSFERSSTETTKKRSDSTSLKKSDLVKIERSRNLKESPGSSTSAFVEAVQTVGDRGRAGTLRETDQLLEYPATFAIAEWNGHKHQPIPTTDRWLYLVQYTAGAEGWNCTDTDATVMYSRHYSWKVTEQARGRIDRMNTPFQTLYYYDFTSDSFIDRAIERALKAKKTFNENSYKSLFEGES